MLSRQFMPVYRDTACCSPCLGSATLPSLSHHTCASYFTILWMLKSLNQGQSTSSVTFEEWWSPVAYLGGANGCKYPRVPTGSTKSLPLDIPGLCPPPGCAAFQGKVQKVAAIVATLGAFPCCTMGHLSSSSSEEWQWNHADAGWVASRGTVPPHYEDNHLHFSPFLKGEEGKADATRAWWPQTTPCLAAQPASAWFHGTLSLWGLPAVLLCVF